MAEARPSILVPLLLIVVVVIAAGVGTGLLYEYNHPKTTPAQRTVAVGDNITVNYIGTLGTGPQSGRVFDTSLYSVASNNVSYPKTVEYAHYGTPSQFTPLPVHVGLNAPASGYSLDGLTFGTVVTGFWQGLLGLPVNHTATISIPPNLGYGGADPACFVTRPLVVTVPVLVTVTPAQFTQLYPRANATVGTEFSDPTYAWTDLVVSTNSSAVVVENLPSLGFSIPGKNWPVVVTALNATTITVTNQLNVADAGRVGGVSGARVCAFESSAGNFVVSSVDLVSGTYTEDFNPEVVGQTLIFQVTVVQFY